MKVKWWCSGCDHVAKADRYAHPSCPHCGTPMLCMGNDWKPGPKGDRFRHYPEGYRVTTYVGPGIGRDAWRVQVVGGHGWKSRQVWSFRPDWNWARADRWSRKRKVKGKIPPMWLRGPGK